MEATPGELRLPAPAGPCPSRGRPLGGHKAGLCRCPRSSVPLSRCCCSSLPSAGCRLRSSRPPSLAAVGRGAGAAPRHGGGGRCCRGTAARGCCCSCCCCCWSRAIAWGRHSVPAVGAARGQALQLVSARPPRGAARRRPPRPPVSGPPAGAGEGRGRGEASSLLPALRRTARSGCGGRSVPPGAAAGCLGRSGRRGPGVTAGGGGRGAERSLEPSAGPAQGSPRELWPLPLEQRSDAGAAPGAPPSCSLRMLLGESAQGRLR